MKFLKKCNEISTKILKIEEEKRIISKPFTDLQDFPEQESKNFFENENEKFSSGLNSNWNSLPTCASFKNNYCPDDDLLDIFLSKHTTVDMEKNYKVQNQSYDNNDLPQNQFSGENKENHLASNEIWENGKVQIEDYEGLNMEKEYEFLKKR